MSEINEIVGVLDLEESEHIIKVFKALANPTRLKVYKLLNDWKYVSIVAEETEMTEANISAIFKQFEFADLVEVEYRSGNHGVRKFARAKYGNINVIV